MPDVDRIEHPLKALKGRGKDVKRDTHPMTVRTPFSLRRASSASNASGKRSFAAANTVWGLTSLTKTVHASLSFLQW